MSLTARLSLIILSFAIVLAGAAIVDAWDVKNRRAQALSDGYSYSVGMPGA